MASRKLSPRCQQKPTKVRPQKELHPVTKTKSKTISLAALRKKAQRQLRWQFSRLDGLSKKDMKHLVNELGTHQIELEMQNEELRSTQIELESSRADYADLYDFSPVGYFTFDKKGLIQKLNLTGAGMLGAEKRFLIAKPIQYFTDTAGRAIFRDHLSDVFKSQTRQTCEINLRRKNGVLFPAQLQSISADSGKGANDICRTAVSDISDRKRAEEHLRESEELFRRAIEEAPIPIIMHAEDGQVLQISRSWTKLTGYTLKDVPTLDAWLNKAYGDGGDRVRDYVGNAFKGSRQSLDIEFPIRTLDDHIRYWNFNASPPGRLRDGRRFVVCMAVDITEHKKAEELQGRLAAIVESAEDAIIGKDLNGIIQTWNMGAENIFGYKAKEVIGKPVSLLVPPKHTDEVPDILARIKRGERVKNFETMRMRKDGTVIPLILTFSAVKDSGGRIIGASKIAHDITQRKKMENDVLKLNEDMAARNLELECLNKELESFTYSVSHDLRAPIRTMAGFAQLLMEDYADKLGNEGNNYLARILAGSEKMARLIEDLMKLSRITRQEVDRIETDLSAKVSTVLQEFQEAAPGRTVEVGIQPGIKILADPMLIEVALLNILANSWKFTSKTEKARIEFGAAEKDGRTVYFIKDNGAGFDATHAEKMFLPFHRLHAEQEFEGTGIGLAIVERIVRRHGGKVWAEGEVGKGATVYFTL